LVEHSEHGRPSKDAAMQQAVHQVSARYSRSFLFRPTGVQL
jgi:hypothetical protein